MKKSLLSLLMCFIAIFANAQNCPNPSAQIDLDVNNVRAKIINGGDLWWNPTTQVNTYEVPIGSSKNAIYSGSIWIGGFDASNQLLTAAQTYRQAGANDFWAGPISVAPGSGNLSISPATCSLYNNLFAITKAEVITFANGGAATPAIINWPGNGNVSSGQLPFLAPFFDANNDGVYDHTTGDYPYFNLSGNYPVNQTTGLTECNDYLFGDKSIWWVFNDIGNVKTETNSGPIGLEIRAQAFAYSATNAAINNTTFYKYQIINRSSGTLFQTHLGSWVDADLGNASDDYVGCDVGRDLGYVYNGDPDDDGGGGYGINPPACGLDFLQGPLADPNDSIDNNHNGVADELGEVCLMSSYMYYDNINASPLGNPNVTDDYFEYLRSIWL
ncbi:MAG: T9SS C-terminal target domain-containing protein, partial [Bacteroidia bacterium]